MRHTPEDRAEIRTSLDTLTIFGFFEIASSNIFELVHITPIPLQKNGTFVIPTVNYRTMALNYNHQVFFELNEAQLAACHLIKEKRYLCDAPVLATMNFTACSLLSMMYNRTAPEACEYTAMTISGILWQKLLMPNTWLFTTNEPTLVAIICNSERDDIQISGTGVLRLDDGCIVKTPSYTIGSLYFLEFKVTETYLMESAPFLGELPITQHIQLQDPLPITNPTALISGPITTDNTFSTRTIIYSQVPWMFLLLIAALIYFYRKACCPIKKKDAAVDEELQPMTTSLEERFNAMLSSLPPQHVQP